MPFIHVVPSANPQQYGQNLLADKFTFYVDMLNNDIQNSLDMGVTININFFCFVSNLETKMPKNFITQHEQIIREIKILANKPKEQCKKSDLNTFLQLVQAFQVRGIERIEINYPLSENQGLYTEIHFPETLIPEDYYCDTGMQIMDYPCRINGGVIEKDTLKTWFTTCGKNENPFTREILLTYSVDNALAAEIKCLLKKAQFLYYVFGGPEKYPDYSEPLLDKHLSYQDFKGHILVEGHIKNTPELFFKQSLRTHLMLMPPASILNWFDLYNININKPSKQDFQMLIEKIIENSDEYPARLLLDHPYVEVARIDVSQLKTMLEEDKAYSITK